MKTVRNITIFFLVLCTVLFSGMVFAEETSSLSTHIMNGSFEIPKVPTISNSDGDISAGAKGAWYLQTNEGFDQKAKEQGYDGFYWRTTAHDEKIELVSVKRGSTAGYNVDPYDGDQFSELVAEEQSSIYQNISTPAAGTVLSWGLSHAGRSTKDTMGLFIGPAQASYQKKTAAGNDIFMWMAELIKNTSQIDWNTADTGCITYIIYSKKDIDLSKVNAGNYTEYFSFTKTVEINQEWHCWAITDDAGTWGSYNGMYTVPENQPETTFAYTALTGHENWPAIAGQYNEGNLLDAIRFTASHPLVVSTTHGGTGSVIAEDETKGEVLYDADYRGSFYEGTEVTVTATPADGYHLIGMYINGVFCTVGEDSSHFADLGNGSYSHSVTMETAKYVQLVFAKEGTVIYNPNGGTYRGSSEDTEITISSFTDAGNNIYEIWNNTEDAIPKNDKTNFIGWYVGRIAHNGAIGGALITSDHTVRYNTGVISGDVSDDTIDMDYTLSVRGGSGSQSFTPEDGIVMIAMWEYKQEIAVKTKSMDDAWYTDDVSGGQVTQSIKDSDSVQVRTNGYGRLNDIVTLKATASDGYQFNGWYDTDGTLISDGDIYEYEVSDAEMVYAYFTELHHPIVSFVSATGKELLNGLGTHTIYAKTGEQPESALLGKGGENVYGSTISTAFITRQLLDIAHPYTYTQWTITIPAPTAENPIYIKKKAEESSTQFVFGNTPVIRDADGVQVKKGNIYKVTALTDGVDRITIKLFNTLYIPTAFTTEGEIEVIYGITLDSIYAPGAKAILDLKTNSADIDFDAVDITPNNNKVVHSESMEEYLNNPNNEYSGAKAVSEAN